MSGGKFLCMCAGNSLSRVLHAFGLRFPTSERCLGRIFFIHLLDQYTRQSRKRTGRKAVQIRLQEVCGFRILDRIPENVISISLS
jgi:hypothetical protein